MSTLILPCVGRRFIDGIPQYIVRHPNGKLLLERSMEGIFPETYDRILIVLLKEDIEKYNAKTFIENEIGERYPIEIVELQEMTSGPAETIYQTLKLKKVEGQIVIKDSDNFICISEQMNANFVAGLDLNEWEKDVHNLRNKSFLVLNEQKNVLDVIEKQIKSDVICLGLYGFKNAENFIKAYEKLNDESYPISRLYISHIISYLIGYSGKVFRYTSATEYENWGDERLWKDMQRDYTLYFIDLDNVLGQAGVLTEKHKEKLTVLQTRGASFIGYTTHGEGFKTAALQVLEKAGLKFIKVVYGCPFSEIKEIIDTDAVLERKVIEL